MEYKEIKIGDFIYLISSNGDFYRKLKPTKNKNGYETIRLGGRKHSLQKVYRLIAECFIPNPDNLPIIKSQG